MKPDLEIRTFDEPKRASRRPKTVVIKTVSTETGGKTKVLTLDANSASFGDDFLYVFTKNVKAARKKNRERSAVSGGGKPVGCSADALDNRRSERVGQEHGV